MSRANFIANDPSLPGLTGLPGVPGVMGVPGVTGFNRQPLTPEQQMQALKRVQAQAEQRVKLGMQLFKAAEARLTGQTDVLQQIKTLQKQLKEQVNNDVAQTLHQYDQWIGQIDESFTTAIRKLEEKIDAVQANVTKSEASMRHMLERAETLLDQSRQLIERSSLKMPELPTFQNVAKHTPAIEIIQPTAKPTASAPIEQPAKQPKQPPARNADTDLHFSAPQVLPPHNPEHEEKIYSRLLQRLIEENRSAEAENNVADKTDDTPGSPDDRADAA